MGQRSAARRQRGFHFLLLLYQIDHGKSTAKRETRGRSFGSAPFFQFSRFRDRGRSIRRSSAPLAILPRTFICPFINSLSAETVPPVIPTRLS